MQALLDRCRARMEAIHHSVILIVALAEIFQCSFALPQA
jgi:hypothetical protein